MTNHQVREDVWENVMSKLVSRQSTEFILIKELKTTQRKKNVQNL